MDCTTQIDVFVVTVDRYTLFFCYPVDLYAFVLRSYQIRFYKNGKWQVVTIDDRIPCKDKIPGK